MRFSYRWRSAITSITSSSATRHWPSPPSDLPDAFLSGTDIDSSVQAAINALQEANLLAEALSPAILQASEDTGNAPNIKRRIVSVYASQIDDATIDAISNFSMKCSGGERVWANAAWLALPF
jgi:hypothetical protein